MNLVMVWRNLGNRLSVVMLMTQLQVWVAAWFSHPAILFSAYPQSLTHSPYLLFFRSWLPLSHLVSLSVSAVLHLLHFYRSLRPFSSLADCFHWSASTCCSLPPSSLILQHIPQIPFPLCWVDASILLCLITSFFLHQKLRTCQEIKKTPTNSLPFSFV